LRSSSVEARPRGWERFASGGGPPFVFSRAASQRAGALRPKMNGAAGAAESDLISRVDTDVVEWFKTRGKGHLTRMNAVLRAYVDAHY
jgi:uncharacterized protein (DUF4415 family)